MIWFTAKITKKLHIFSFKIPGIKLWTLLAPSQRSDHNTSWYWTQIFQFEAITEISAELKN